MNGRFTSEPSAYMARIKNVGWTVGTYCNAACSHCYSARPRQGVRQQLTADDIDRIVGQLVHLQVATVNIGGNEPIFTHGPDPSLSLLPYLITQLDEAGLAVGFTTNGTTFECLDRQYPDALRRVDDLDFSLDWPDAKRHDETRRAPLYHTVIRSLRRARELQIPASMVICATTDNFTPDTLDEFLQLCEEMGCELRFNLLKPVEPRLLAQMPSPEQVYKGFAHLYRRAECVAQCESFLTSFAGAGSQTCPCGTSSFRIGLKTADGRVPITPCVYLNDFATGDLLSEDVFDILSSPAFRRIRFRNETLPSACREADCRFAEKCRGGCAARAYFTSGTIDAPDPYCPLEYLAAGAQAPILEAKQNRQPTRTRVHEDYLCTWIGAPATVTEPQANRRPASRDFEEVYTP